MLWERIYLSANWRRYEGQYEMDKKHGYGVYQLAEVKQIIELIK